MDSPPPSWWSEIECWLKCQENWSKGQNIKVFIRRVDVCQEGSSGNFGKKSVVGDNVIFVYHMTCTALVTVCWAVTLGPMSFYHG